MTDALPMRVMARNARRAAKALRSAVTAQRNDAIAAIVDQIRSRQNEILHANQLDMNQAKMTGLAQPLQDRLYLDKRGIETMCTAAQSVGKLPDPIGAMSDSTRQSSGIVVGKMRIPLGVIGMIYESRPNVTVEASTLCIKSGNACILRGGSEAIHSNIAIAECIESGLEETGLTKFSVQVVRHTNRDAVTDMLQQDDYIDLIIPRGGKSLIQKITEESNIPVLKHLDGVCHVYIEESADIDMALAIAVNSKVSKMAVCNAAETILVDRQVAPRVLPSLRKQLSDYGVSVRACVRSLEIDPSFDKASDVDWTAEYLGPLVALRVVDGIDEAIHHIEAYGSGHTDTIVSNNHDRITRFITEIDSASVIVNASTQFADGFEYGLGAEIGISTDKLHARGPVGLEGLTTQKFVVQGNGEVRIR